MNLDAVRAFPFPATEAEYTFRDSILYALGLGYGADPLDRGQLAYVTEDNQRVVPTQCNILGYPGFWMRNLPELGFDWIRVVHGEQAITLHGPLPPAGRIVSHNRIVAIDDKGADKGAAVYFEREIVSADSGQVLAHVRTTTFARGDGGQGGFGDVPAPVGAIEASVPDATWKGVTSLRAALIYRLSGDYNPIHSSPETAREAGFERPILHGMCTMGVACRAVLETYCGNDPARLKAMFVRFSKPVFPGETIRIEFFNEKNGLRFRGIAVERGAIVLDRCSAEISA